MPFTGPLSVTVGWALTFRGEGHYSIADRRLHMLEINGKRSSDFVFQYIAEIFWLPALLTLVQLLFFIKNFVSRNFY